LTYDIDEFDAHLQHDVAILLGDLNYRLTEAPGVGIERFPVSLPPSFGLCLAAGRSHNESETGDGSRHRQRTSFSSLPPSLPSFAGNFAAGDRIRGRGGGLLEAARAAAGWGRGKEGRREDVEGGSVQASSFP